MKKIAYYIVCLMLIVSCKQKAASEKTKMAASKDPNEITLNATQLENSGIKVGFPSMQEIHAEIKVTGTVDVPPSNLVSVSFPLGGYVKSIKLLPGAQIRKGQVIALLEDQNYVQMQQDYLAAKAELEYLSADLQRQKTLSEADAASRKNYQLIQSKYAGQQVILHALAEKLKIININPNKLNVHNLTIDRPVYAPINGFVSQVNVNIGQFVTPSDVLVTLINPDDQHASMAVFEKDLPVFKAGMQGAVFLNEDTSKKYPVEVILVSRNLDSTGKALVHCHFEEHEPHLIPGTFLNGLFAVSGGKSVAVPDDAVVRYYGRDYVFTTRDGKTFRLQEVTVGSSSNGYTALLPRQGMDWPHTQIALEGAYSLIGALKNSSDEEE